MRWTRRDPLGDPERRHSLLLTGAFLLGAVAGCLWPGGFSGSVRQDISRYLADYLTLTRQEGGALSGAWALAAAYAHFPLLAFAAGFTSLGFLLLPAAAAVFGFSLSYAAACLRWAFGARGLLVAGGLFGLRCLFTIPCFFLLAVPAWSASGALLRLSLAGGPAPPPLYGRDWWLRFGLVCGVLCAGFCADLWLSPVFLAALAAP